MPEELELEELLKDNEDDPELVRQLRGVIRQQASAFKELQSSSAVKDKAIAFAQLGIDTTKGVGKLYFQTYDGELTAEAIQARAKEEGIPLSANGDGEAAPPPPTNKATPEEIEAHKTLQETTAGATKTDDQVKGDPRTESLSAGMKAMEEGKTFEDAFADAFELRVKAADEGDERVIYEDYSRR